MLPNQAARKRLEAAQKKHADELARRRGAVRESAHTFIGDRRYITETKKG